MHSQAFANLKTETRNELKAVGHFEKAVDIDYNAASFKSFGYQIVDGSISYQSSYDFLFFFYVCLFCFCHINNQLLLQIFQRCS